MTQVASYNRHALFPFSQVRIDVFVPHLSYVTYQLLFISQLIRLESVDAFLSYAVASPHSHDHSLT